MHQSTRIRDYSYIYEKLIAWCLDKFNNQQNEGPAELIHDYLLEAGKPSKIMISIGATRYTEFGRTNFLQNQDDAVVVVYPENKYSAEEIKKRVETKNYDWEEDISVLTQTVKTEF